MSNLEKKTITLKSSETTSKVPDVVPDVVTESVPESSETESVQVSSSSSASSDDQPKLISDVKKLVQTFNERKKDDVTAEREGKRQEHEKRLDENRTKGSNALFHHLKDLVIDKVKTYAGYGKSEARIYEFTFGDEDKFENCYTKDLLSKGTVISQLQNWLDEEHSELVDGQKERAFFTYFNMVGRRQYDRTANKFAVFVNWDKTLWASIKERLDRSSAVRGRTDQVQDGQPHDNRQPRDNQERQPRPPRDNQDSQPRTYNNQERQSRPPRDNQDRQPRDNQDRQSRPPRDNQVNQSRQPRDNQDRQPRNNFQRKGQEVSTKSESESGWQEVGSSRRPFTSSRGRGRGATAGFRNERGNHNQTADNSNVDVPVSHVETSNKQ